MVSSFQILSRNSVKDIPNFNKSLKHSRRVTFAAPNGKVYLGLWRAIPKFPTEEEEIILDGGWMSFVEDNAVVNGEIILLEFVSTLYFRISIFSRRNGPLGFQSWALKSFLEVSPKLTFDPIYLGESFFDDQKEIIRRIARTDGPSIVFRVTREELDACKLRVN